MSDPYPPTELLDLLATGELAAWRRYLLGAACLERFDASPGGVRPPNEVGAEMAAAGKLHTRLAYHFAAPGSEPLIAPAWAPLPDADDWLPFRTWGFPDDEPFIL